MLIKKVKSQLLAEAVSIYDKEIKLEFNENDMPNCIDKKEYKNTININENIKLDISLIYINNFSAFTNKQEYIMDIFIYLDDIDMAKYTLKLNLLENSKLYRPWECIFYVINYPIPDKMLQIINNWADDIICNYEMIIKEEAEKNYKQKLSEYLDNMDKIKNKY